MSYTIDKNLEKGMRLLENEGKTEEGIELINHSAKTGTTKGKSYFSIAQIIREGKFGVQTDVEKSRVFYDRAAEYLVENPDSMDYLYLGDYFNYGLGSQATNKQKALEYYELASRSNDSIKAIAEERADVIRSSFIIHSKKENTLSDSLGAPHPVESSVFNSLNAAPNNSQFGISFERIEPSSFGGVQDDLPTSFTTPPVANQIFNDNATINTPAIDSEYKDDILLVKALKLLDSPASSLQDKVDGFELVRTSCDEGSVRAAVLLGYFYEGKTSIKEKNLEEAQRYYELAISRGSVVAEFRLGLLYLIQNTSFTNEDKGHQLILSSARKGYSFALNYLGDCFREKVMDPRNLSLAYRYYALAGERNLGLAYHNMAEIDASRQDIELARKHEDYAKKLGYDANQSPYDSLASVLHF